MTDTPQPETAGENVATLEDGAAAFKALLNPQPAIVRDPATGQFAPRNPEEAPEVEEEATAAEPESGEETGEADETDDAPEEGQQDDVPMPASWDQDKAEHWSSLPPELKAYVAEREGQRDHAVNAKFQEYANSRKDLESKAAEANANRDHYAKATEQLIDFAGQLFPKPTPSQYGAGTGAFDQESYLLATEQWDLVQANLSAFDQQRQKIVAQQEKDEREATAARLQAVEDEAYPKFLADVPGLATPKGQEIVNGLIKYGLEHGIAPTAFQPGEITSREMHILWKASEYDRIKAAEKRVKAANPPPKPAGPVVKPGGVTPRQTIQNNRLGAAEARLAKTGSLDDAAAVFKAKGF